MVLKTKNKRGKSMIIDRIENAKLYHNLNQKIKMALDFLQNTNLDSLKEGRYEIEAEDIFAIVVEYKTKNKEVSEWEAHKKYIDIQYVVKGKELIGYKNIDSMIQKTEYDNKKDIFFLDGDGDFIELKEGMLGIYFPEDVHMPGVSCKESNNNVKKVIVKVRCKY